MKISIITVCLNSGKTIEKTIQSVIYQDGVDYEYIIIDGKSTDGTLEVISQYKDKISLVISETDEGIYDAMNKGIALASGDVIGILNADDWYEPDALKEAERCFQDPRTEAIYGNMNLVYENGEIETIIPGDIEKIRYQMEMPHPTVFIRRGIYEKYGTFEKKYKIAADYDLVLRLYVKGVNFQYRNKVLVNFLLGGISTQKEEEAEEEALAISERYLPYAPLEKRKKYTEIILHRRKGLGFIKMLNDFPYVLTGIFIEKFGISPDDGIAIFGAGRWGRRVHNILRQNGIRTSFLVDNDSGKWEKSIGGILVLPPDSLKSFQGVLLVAVRDFSTEIMRQIKEMGNTRLYCIAWEELVDEFMKREV